MNYPAASLPGRASSGVSKPKSIERPKGRGMKPLPASGGIQCRSDPMKTKIDRYGILLTLCFFFPATPSVVQSVDYDLLIKNANVFDGSLKDPFQADVAESIAGTAARVIDAKEPYLCPGVITLHTHVDRGMNFTAKALNTC